MHLCSKCLITTLEGSLSKSVYDVSAPQTRPCSGSTQKLIKLTSETLKSRLLSWPQVWGKYSARRFTRFEYLQSLRHDVQAGARVLSCVFVGTYVLALASRNSKPDDKQDKSITIRLTTCFQLHLSILLTHSVTNTQTHSHRSPQQTVWPPHTSRLSEPPGRPCYRSGWSPGNSRTVTRRAISQVE